MHIRIARRVRNLTRPETCAGRCFVQPRARGWLACIAALALTGCNAIADFGDFDFSDEHHGRDAGGAPPRDAAAGDAALDADDAGSDCATSPSCCYPNEIPEVSCSGEVDNDCDGDVDCADSDCAASELCCSPTGPEVGALACGDGVDNDCDGLIDCNDPACLGQAICCNVSGDEHDDATCSDSIDNDCDGAKDCLDPGCFDAPVCCPARTPEDTSEACTDDIDNDCDGQFDCRDDDCATVLECMACSPSPPSATSELSCTDSIDNDCDRDRDCRDSDCAGSLACCTASGAESSELSCVDGIDNDCDGLLDCADPDCSGQLNCCVATPETSAPACMDGLDNDCDGAVDCADASCDGQATCCTWMGTENTQAACTDGSDNDCDGLVNCADPDCGDIPGAGCCVVNGTEQANPNDGRDNDCNGNIDIPILMSAYPPLGLASAGAEVRLRFAPEINALATLECRTQRRAGGSSAAWASCPIDGMDIKPHTPLASSKPENDGAWRTSVRWRFAEGRYSDQHDFDYYIHHTLHGAPHCSTLEDSKWFDAARPRLESPDAGTFRRGVDTFIANPFVRVTYEPPLAARFEQDGGAKPIDMWSLRRRFTLSSDNKLLLITRNYQATRGVGSCEAAKLRVHLTRNTASDGAMRNDKRFLFHRCRAIVLNRAGAGVCMRDNAGAPDFVAPSNDGWWKSVGWGAPRWAQSNKFMWRILVERADVEEVAGKTIRGYRNFTLKCAEREDKLCPGAKGIFIPDRGLFSQ